MAIAAKLNAENVLLRDTDITLSEKRAFILAARQAYADGKKSFVYDFLSSMRQKINDPLGVRAKKRKEISQR